jgi:hypothetical protein
MYTLYDEFVLARNKPSLAPVLLQVLARPTKEARLTPFGFKDSPWADYAHGEWSLL